MQASEEQLPLIIQLLQTCKDNNNVRTGANEVTKLLSRGNAQLVILAMDCQPPEIIAHLPLICEDKNVTYLYVSSKALIKKALNIDRNVIACGVFADNDAGLNRNDKLIRKILGMNKSVVVDK